MQFDEEREVAMLCDLCYERLQNNQEPACSQACPTGCIIWGDMDTISQEIERRVLEEQELE
jgi:formate dehydrogenase iron-sulfur subunit